MNTTVLLLGDRSDWETYERVCNQVKKHHSRKFNWITATYEQIEKNKLPVIESDAVIIFLFFPFTYWDKYIEKEGQYDVYGNVEFYNKFREFWSEIYITLKRVYDGKKVHFINHPLKIAIDRDKEVTKAILSESGIKVPKPYYTRYYKNILKLVNQDNKKLFLKVRYGSMGKGITYMERGNWKTNFRFENDKIISLHSASGWTFVDVTDNIDFLKELLTKDIIIEDSIESYIIDSIIFDLRLYVFYDDVLYIFPRTNDKDAIISNISQGGKGRSSHFLKRFPKGVINNAIESAIKTAQSMGINFAGVDVMIDRKLNVNVIELNAFPGFPKVKRFNLSKRIIQQIENRDWN